MKWIVALFLLVWSSLAWAQEPPPNFFHHKKELIEVIRESWPGIGVPAVIPAQIEKETCITLKHSKCWSRFAELKTSREIGTGLGQITRAFNKDGSIRFDAFEEAKALDSRLKDWKWEDRFNARYQMIAVVAMLRRNHHVFRSAETELDHMAFALASYNGGVGGIQSDRRICKNTKDCNPNLWFGNVERTSLKAKTAVSGYGKSFFQINREYPKTIIFDKAPRYEPYINTIVINSEDIN